MSARLILAVSAIVLLVTQTLAEENADMDFKDSVWLKETADELAFCVGTYRGAAYMMRLAGQDATADYIEDTARGAGIASMYLLRIRADLQGSAFSQEGADNYIEGIAHGKETYFKMMIESATEKERTEYINKSMKPCAELNVVQGAIVQAVRESTTIDNN